MHCSTEKECEEIRLYVVGSGLCETIGNLMENEP